MGKFWTPEEDEILLAYPEKYGVDLVHLLPDRTKTAINQRRKILGLAKPHKRNEDEHRDRPLAEESAYHIRKDYAAKIKLGYTHEKAVDWLVEANLRYREIIEDVLTNPKYDADFARCERRSKYTP